MLVQPATPLRSFLQRNGELHKLIEGVNALAVHPLAHQPRCLRDIPLLDCLEKLSTSVRIGWRLDGGTRCGKGHEGVAQESLRFSRGRIARNRARASVARMARQVATFRSP